MRPATDEATPATSTAPVADEPVDPERAAKVAELRRAYLAGELDLSIDEDGPGMDQLLAELLPERPRPPRAPRRRRER